MFKVLKEGRFSCKSKSQADLIPSTALQTGELAGKCNSFTLLEQCLECLHRAGYSGDRYHQEWHMMHDQHLLYIKPHAPK